MVNRQKIHVSRFITALSLGIVGGAALIYHVPQDWFFVSLPAVVCAIAIFMIGVFRRTRLFIVFVLLAGLVVGLYVGGTTKQSLMIYEQLYGQELVLVGTVADDIAVNDDDRKSFLLSHVHAEGKQLPGVVWIGTQSKLEVKRGDTLTVQGVLNKGFGTISASIFRARVIDATRPVPGDVGRQARDWLSERVRLVIDEPEASLGISYLTGYRRTLPADVSDQLRVLGLTHLVVASGFHLTILVGLARRLLTKQSKYASFLFACLVIVSFLLITGFSTSMTRASLVAGISLLAWFYGRVIHPVVLLSVVAAITVIIDPTVVWGNVGWLLSFSAFAGVIIVAPLLQHYFWGKDRKINPFTQIVLATSAAQLTTFPVIAYYFGQYSPLALLSNLLFLPLVPFTMLATLIAGLFATLPVALGGLLALPASALLRYMTMLADWLSAQPLAYGEVEFNSIQFALSYLAIGLLIVFLQRRTKHKFDSNVV